MGNSALGIDTPAGDGGIGLIHPGYGASISYCLFSGNSASRGGGIRDWNGSDTTIINCSFHNNSASEYAGAVSIAGCASSSALVRNSIVWDNEPDDDSGIVNLPSGKCGIPVMNADYSILQRDWQDHVAINNCLVVDPCFADAASGDYHLKSQAGRWDPDSESWVLDDVTSPGIDAGNPTNPVGPEPFPNGGRINMGAYGGTEEASKSFCGDRYSEEAAAADINGDCRINWRDFAIMALHWLKDNRQ